MAVPAQLHRRRQIPLEQRLARAVAYRDEIEPLVNRGIATQLDLDEIDAEVRGLQPELELVEHDRAEYEYRYIKWQESRR